MILNDLSEIRLEAGVLADELRDVAGAGRSALAGLAESARASRAALRDTSEATRALSGVFRSTLGSAFRSAALDGAKLSDVLKGLALDLSRSVASRALGGLSNQIGNALGQGLGSLLPFAKGGVVTGRTVFPMARGMGLMGEAGPEAVMPLRRGPDGRLGVAASGGKSVVQVTINTPDVESFQRSRSQIAATLARAVDRGRRNL